MSSKFMDELVYRYLHSKGQHDMVKVLEEKNKAVESEDVKEIEATATTTALKDEESFILCEDIVLGAIQGGNYNESLLQMYKVYSAWASSSLDFLKPELLMLCLPIFSYCYICLIRKELHDLAISFWNDNMKIPPDLTLFYSDELSQLSLLLTSKQLHNIEFLNRHQFIKCVIQNKYLVKMSKFGYGLLKSFILVNDLLYLATILNEKCLFQLYDIDDTNMASDITISSIELQGYQSAFIGNDNNNNNNGSNNSNIDETDRRTSTTTATTITAVPKALPYVNLFIPGKIPIEIATLEKAVDEKKHKFNDDVVVSELLQKLLRPKLLLSKKRCLEISSKKSSSSSSSSSSVINSKNALFVNNTWMASSSSKNKGNSLEPSILFATITNTYNDMICLDINKEMTQAVAGFRDNTLRIFNLKLSHNNNSDTTQNMNQLMLKHGSFNDLSYHVDHTMNNVFPLEKQKMDDILKNQKNIFKNIKQSTLSTTTTATTTGGGNNSLFNTNEGDTMIDPMIQLFGHTKPIYGVSQDVTGKSILSASADKFVRLWDINVCQCLAKFPCNNVIWDVEFNPIFDCYFSTANQDGTLFIFNMNRLNPIRLLAGHTSDVNCCCWSNNGLILASGSDDKTVRIWDFRDSNCVRVLADSVTSISCVTISKDGRLVANGTDSGSIYVYDIYTSKLVGILQGHKNNVTSIAFNESTTSLVSGSLDNTVRVWNIHQLISDYSSTSIFSTSSSSSSSNSRSNNSNSINTLMNPISNLPQQTASSTTLSLTNGDHHHHHHYATNSTMKHLYRNRLTENHSILKNLKYSGMLPSQVNILSSHKVYYTKHTPVYYVNYTAENMIYAGGPFSVIDSSSRNVTMS